MHHSHFRHSRIERLMSARHHLQAELTDDAIDTGLLEDRSPSATSNLPATDVISDETCDPSTNATCLDHEMDGFDTSPQKRDKTTPTDTTVVETVLQVVDTNSHTLWQSTGAAFPTTFSDPAVGTFTIPTSDSTTATATAAASVSVSATLSIATLPPLVSATQSTTSLLSESSLSSITNSTQSTTSTASTTSRVPLSSRLVSAISSLATSTPLVAPSTISSSTFNSPYGYYWSTSESNWSSSTSTSSTYTVDYSPSSTSSYGTSGETSTETESGSTPTASETTAAGTGSSSQAAKSKIVGGVVGSIAGLALLLFLVVFLLRRRGLLRGKNATHAPLSDDAAIGAGNREIAERRSSNDPLFTASYFAPAFMKRWRQSTQTVRTESTIDSNSSERGFQKISGRKLPPVLTHGGDGFGGGLDGDSPTLPGFAPTSPGPGPSGSPAFHAPPPASPYGMPLDSNYTREIEEHQPPVRPSPVHLPISNTVPVATPVTVTPAHPVAQPQSAIPIVPQRPDGLGRSLPSFDGSRSSRFTEGIDM
ncbi:hypothetical protein N7508_008629 [Penicillium antarcticum]|uniref:uncharacterized protein n=1 Tax=Penicillium antarcticum TaxID=416450 RepID=UPI0023973F0A|nr:uncharacterized protein N7508_008629 [Penicillium antarcticum]KAJ5293808.1 hypothetical protein N7508_008629 [Penicillium antarcticum]